MCSKSQYDRTNDRTYDLVAVKSKLLVISQLKYVEKLKNKK